MRLMYLKRTLSLFLVALSVFLIAAVGFSGVYAKTDYQSYADKLDKTTYQRQLGAIYSKDATTFKVWSPTSDSVKVRLYKSGSDTDKSSGYYSMSAMKMDKSTGVWSVKIKGNLKNTYYTYVIKRGKKTYETTDIYAKACGVNGERSMVVDLDSTDPDGWEDDHHVTVDDSTDAKIWEIQISDFSSSETSGVSQDNRGKYLAFTETGTTVNSVSGARSTCVDYLKELGVNYVQINPFYDFGSIDETDTSDNDENYNWGYDPVNYNCPEGSYSSNPNKGAVRIKECKQMIQALHNAGIGVIMDVVYNHTLESEDSNFNITVPDYYYRLNSDGSYSDGSGCGNDLATERTMMSKYIVDSVVYWAQEYHIDGFRFDLMGLIDVDTMNNIRSALDELEDGTKLLMYGEPWKLSTAVDSDTSLANTDNISKLSDRIAAFDDTYRDALKGSTSGTDKGFIQSGANKSNLKIGIGAQTDSSLGWANAPTQTVTCASCHDNLTLWDKLVKSVIGSDGSYSERYSDLVAMNKLAGAVTYTSQGITFMLAGEEFCRTKQGDENSYNSGVQLNQIDWSFLETYGDVSDYYKGLIEIRDNISAFTDTTSDTADSIEYLENMPDKVLAYKIKDDIYGEVCMIFNASDEAQTVSTDGDWVQLANEETAGMQSLGNVGNKLKVFAYSAAILVDRDSYNSAELDVNTGKVIVNYYCDDEVFKSYVVNGKIGESYNISQLTSVKMDYDIVNSTGDTGTFSDSVKYCNFYCEKYEGEVSSVTFKFLDEDTGKAVADFVVMTNRRGQSYTLSEIPSVDGYALDMKKLPKNACGEFSDKDKTVKFYYNKKDKDDKTCKVNIIYMSSQGDILGTDTLSGEKKADYSTTQIDIENYEFASVTDNSSGTFSKTEQNVLYIYEPVSFLSTIIPIICIVLIVIVFTAFAILFFKRKKKELMDDMEIS